MHRGDGHMCGVVTSFAGESTIQKQRIDKFRGGFRCLKNGKTIECGKPSRGRSGIATPRFLKYQR